jgi:hypothetical protein
MSISDTRDDDPPRKESKPSTILSGGDTLSCVKCGAHKPRKYGNFERKFGGRLFVCFDCKPQKKTA